MAGEPRKVSSGTFGTLGVLQALLERMKKLPDPASVGLVLEAEKILVRINMGAQLVEVYAEVADWNRRANEHILRVQKP